MKRTELSIIIITYNSEKYIKDCLNSILKTCSKISYKTIVYDNNSNDRTKYIIESDFKWVKLIKSETNKGFAKGNNEAAKMSNEEFILLLNHDTILLNPMENVLNAFKNIKNAGALGIKMVDRNRNYIRSTGRFPKPFELIKFYLFNYNSKEFINGDFANPDKVKNVDWISGAFLLTTKKTWATVHGLDERYFMYVEDVDYCKKLKLIGLKTVFLPSSAFIHFVGFNKSREKYLINGYGIFSEKYFQNKDKAIAKICLQLNYGYKKIKGFY